MLQAIFGLALVGASCIQRVVGMAATDSYMDADPAQSGYLDNHNMDPNVVGSSAFGQLWKVPFNSLELVRTTRRLHSPGSRLLFLAKSTRLIFASVYLLPTSHDLQRYR